MVRQTMRRRAASQAAGIVRASWHGLFFEREQAEGNGQLDEIRRKTRRTDHLRASGNRPSAHPPKGSGQKDPLHFTGNPIRALAGLATSFVVSDNAARLRKKARGWTVIRKARP